MLAVLPTGYGKTAAFTYALQFESDAGDGLTVIVVPTNTIKQQVLQQFWSWFTLWPLAISYRSGAMRSNLRGWLLALSTSLSFRLSIWCRVVRCWRR
jgi:superfamily II DNA or RNA helicase